jgi:hypothetical protein
VRAGSGRSATPSSGGRCTRSARGRSSRADCTEARRLPPHTASPRGLYEGETLVVESSNFDGRNDLRGSDANLRLVERFTRVDAGTLRYKFTVDNPTAFTRPWTAVLPMARSEEPLFEYGCHEGNHALTNILRGARAQERE